VLAAAALARLLAREPAGPVIDPWDIPDGWRPGGPAWTRLRLGAVGSAGSVAEVRVRGRASAGAEVAVGAAEPVPCSASLRDGELVLSYGGRTSLFTCAFADSGLLWLGRDGRAWALREEQAVTSRGDAGTAGDGTVTSPMPGIVLAVNIAEGQDVTSGEPMLIVEAMKMEHAVTAPFDGTVAEVTVKPGQQVAMDETLAVIQGRQPDARLPTRSRT
jgi:acetyl-CoA/propionyl-CoA carboxylase biotin carboxyl carrier protein